MVICCVAGCTEMSLVVRNSIPARMLTFKSSATRASRKSWLLELEKDTCTSPVTASGFMPFACNAFWEAFLTTTPSEQAGEALIILQSVEKSWDTHSEVGFLAEFE